MPPTVSVTSHAPRLSLLSHESVSHLLAPVPTIAFPPNSAPRSNEGFRIQSQGLKTNEGLQFPAPDGQHALKRNSACGHPAPPPFLPPAIPPTTPLPILTSHAAAKQMRRGCPNCRATYNSISNRLAIPRVVNATGIMLQVQGKSEEKSPFVKFEQPGCWYDSCMNPGAHPQEAC